MHALPSYFIKIHRNKESVDHTRKRLANVWEESLLVHETDVATK
jgi:hypothetical protein